MSETIIIFPSSKDNVFDDMCQEYYATIRNMLRNIFGLNDIHIMKLSFLNYQEKRVYPEFPVNKRLYVHNTSLLSKFGFGRYVGAFFDVIIRILPSMNLVNMRIFYGVDDGERPSPALAASPAIAASPALAASQAIAPEEKYVNILGQDRILIKRGRTSYVNIDGKEYTLTEARKLESKKR